MDLVGENALLRAGIAYAHYQPVQIGFGQDQEVVSAEQNAKKALELDPYSAEAHFTLGLIYSCLLGDQRRACDHLELSLEARPYDAHTISWLVIVYFVVGKMEAATPLMTKARQLDPLDPLARWLPAHVSMGLGQYG